MIRALPAVLLIATALLLGCDTSEVLDDLPAVKKATSTEATGSVAVESASSSPAADVALAVGADAHSFVDVKTSVSRSPNDYWHKFQSSVDVRNRSKQPVDVVVTLEQYVENFGIGYRIQDAGTKVLNYHLDPLGEKGEGWGDETLAWRVRSYTAKITN